MNRKESRKHYAATWPSWNLKNFHTKTAEYTIFKNTNNVFIKIYMLSHIKKSQVEKKWIAQKVLYGCCMHNH